ncbi:uncharacterized protein N7498_007388 [Penicillium cinerascens]|uniref:Xylanolytic transcriptional activator regulatory domain-containing protein n=1 Tax=Penicillium cinerascens TaxID=70096 RepID=A0A9W9JQ93_9EURO|nr:uncharacterized protein N7498_007388 [Penicillium cinerascens]KAJ5198271.1 hypothetical protein N7498_007388 [Penicillium cinerascens]
MFGNKDRFQEEEQLAGHSRKENPPPPDSGIETASSTETGIEESDGVQFGTEISERGRLWPAPSATVDHYRQEWRRLPHSLQSGMVDDDLIAQLEVRENNKGPIGSWGGFGPNSALFGPTASIPRSTETWMLVQEFLDDFNCAIPLFDKDWVRATFIRLYEDGETLPGNSSLAFHIILAIAYRLRAQSPLSNNSDDLQAREHLKVACSQLGNLLMQEPSLSQVQCLVGIATVLQGTHAAGRAAIVISSALRITQQLGVSRPSDAQIDLPDRCQLQLVFWIAFFTDVSICMRTKQAPTIIVGDGQFDLPPERPSDGSGMILAVNDEYSFNILRFHVQLAVLQNQVLVSTSSPRPTYRGRAPTGESFQILCQAFRAWRLSLPAAINLPGMYSSLHRSDIVHVLILEAKALETVCAIHGITNDTPANLKSDHLSGDNQPLSFISENSLVVEEARRFLNLLALAPVGDVACNRLNIEAFVSAAFVMLVRIVRCPSLASAESDLALAQTALTQAKWSVHSNAGDTNPSLQTCLTLQTLAEKFIVQENQS